MRLAPVTECEENRYTSLLGLTMSFSYSVEEIIDKQFEVDHMGTKIVYLQSCIYTQTRLLLLNGICYL